MPSVHFEHINAHWTGFQEFYIGEEEVIPM